MSETTFEQSTQGAREQRLLEEMERLDDIYYPEGGDQRVELYRAWAQLGGLMLAEVRLRARTHLNARIALRMEGLE